MRYFYTLLLIAGLVLPSLRAQTPITDAEREEFGQFLADCFNEGDMGTLVARMDQNAYLDLIVDGLGLSAAELVGFREGALKGLATTIEKQFGNFTAGRFLRLQDSDRGKRILIRVLSDDGAVNYFGFIAGKSKKGELVWQDCFIFLAGETMGETSRRTVLPLVSQMRKGALGFLKPKEAEYAQAFPMVHKASLQMQGGQLIQAWHTLEPLPEAVKLDRTVIMLRLRIAQGIDEAKYLRVMEEWEKTYPGDQSLDLISIDSELLRKNYAGCLRRIAAVNQRVGGDPYLLLLSANVCIESGDYETARKNARQVLADEPTLYGAYDTLMSIGLRSKNPKETLAVLDEFGERFPTVDVDAQIVHGDEAFADFRQTDEYKAWAEARKAKAEATEAPAAKSD
ncbi:hypothetical protein ESB00_09925 [Oleiharenicola lentus]|uniref:Tetratricopeptide repeat protein n=1 Tax=Oleiharenicola lentus TaxID=2508720 RepID=A0A4Q1CAP5_9BACT|nr:hypothetical protein [Oleiharenicola lentus]RXK56167.1 hypothetical protein ESB00_09925 [Oleiharenicola lentus]